MGRAAGHPRHPLCSKPQLLRRIQLDRPKNTAQQAHWKACLEKFQPLLDYLALDSGSEACDMHVTNIILDHRFLYASIFSRFVAIMGQNIGPLGAYLSNHEFCIAKTWIFLLAYRSRHAGSHGTPDSAA
jgi:hypothetical protein